MTTQDHAVLASGTTGPERHHFDAAARRSFQRDGFVSVAKPVASSTSLDATEAILRSQLQRSLGDATYRDLANGEPMAPQIHEIVHVTRRVPALLRGEVFASLESLAGELLATERVRLHFDHVILKPPHNGAATSFHQDIAFDPETDEPMATIWLSFCDVQAASGCMQYIPGSHTIGLLEHHRSGRDGMAAEVSGLGDAVACPLPRGGVSIHGTRTVHGSGPNDSDEPRLAWIIKFVPEARSRPRAAVSNRYRRLKYALEYR